MLTTLMASRLRIAASALSALSLVACASPPSPAPALAAGAASLEAARAANAGELAAVDMNNARQKLDRARVLAQTGHRREAIRLAEQADVDAQLARARAGSERTRLAVVEVEQGLRTLREELSRIPAATLSAPETATDAAPGAGTRALPPTSGTPALPAPANPPGRTIP